MEAENREVISSSPRKRRRTTKEAILVPSHVPVLMCVEVIYDVVEEILLRLPVKSLLRFKSVSKRWRWTIESRCFEERHLKMAERFFPQVLVFSVEDESLYFGFRKICLDSASFEALNLLNFPQAKLSFEGSDSCDGLVCIYGVKNPSSIYVVNPATRWFRQLPLARFQVLMQKAKYTRETLSDIKPFTRLAFTKATSCDYKLVWLYNYDKYNFDASSPNQGLTKCEVFDFRANSWRYVTCTLSYQIFDDQRPASVNGTLYWLTERYNGETKIIAFNLHTETFRVLPNKNPVADSHPDHIEMCSLDNRLCMSKRKRQKMIQEIWILQSSSENAWEKMYSIDLGSCCEWSENGIGYSWTRMGVVRPSTPVAICKNNKILLSHRYSKGLVEYDPQTNSYSSFHEHLDYARVVSNYFQSLISHI